MSEQTAKPTNKVAAGALAGGIVAVLMWITKTFSGVEVSPDAAVGLSTIITFMVQYLVPNATGTQEGE